MFDKCMKKAVHEDRFISFSCYESSQGLLSAATLLPGDLTPLDGVTATLMESPENVRLRLLRPDEAMDWRVGRMLNG